MRHVVGSSLRMNIARLASMQSVHIRYIYCRWTCCDNSEEERKLTSAWRDCRGCCCERGEGRRGARLAVQGLQLMSECRRAYHLWGRGCCHFDVVPKEKRENNVCRGVTSRQSGRTWEDYGRKRFPRPPACSCANHSPESFTTTTLARSMLSWAPR